jgi:hypothetical protein
MKHHNTFGSKMAKSHYSNFNEYAAADHQYLMRAIKGELYKSQSKIEFRDGTTYHVTKSGSRYWEKNRRTHREDGPSAEYIHGKWFSLFGVTFNEDEYPLAVNRLNFLRLQTDNELEPLVEEIGRNMHYEKRQDLWKSILQGSTDSTAMIISLKKLSNQYNKLAKMSDKFIQDFS